MVYDGDNHNKISRPEAFYGVTCDGRLPVLLDLVLSTAMGVGETNGPGVAPASTGALFLGASEFVKDGRHKSGVNIF